MEKEVEKQLEENENVNEVEDENKSFREDIESFRIERQNTLYKKIFNKKDIKFRGPFSYRFLRIFAWASIIVSQLIVFNAYCVGFFDWHFVNDGILGFLSILPDLSRPLFIIASFGLILSGKRSYLGYLLGYGAGFLGLAAGASLIYGRYIMGTLEIAQISQYTMQRISDSLTSSANINVFSDLFCFILFICLIEVKPKKYFQGKKILIIRSLTIIPIAYIIVSYVLQVLDGFHIISLSFYAYVFMTTKSPLIFMLFCTVYLWIKNREHIYLKFGATREEYQEFLSTNRNSLYFSLVLILILLIFAIIEFTIIAIISFTVTSPLDENFFLIMYRLVKIFSLDECINTLIAIPLILLYSYTRDHKNRTIDLLLPAVGVAGIILLYLECGYQLANHLASISI